MVKASDADFADHYNNLDVPPETEQTARRKAYEAAGLPQTTVQIVHNQLTQSRLDQKQFRESWESGVASQIELSLSDLPVLTPRNGTAQSTLDQVTFFHKHPQKK